MRAAPTVFPMPASATTFVLSALLPLAAGAQYVPPDGLYRIDGSARLTTPGATATLRTEGASGNATLEQTAADGARASSSYPGSGPQTVCLHKGAPPAAFAAQRCRNLQARSGTNGGAVHVSCASADATQTWRRIDERTWEATWDVVQDLADTSHAAGDARSAIAMAAANGTPAQRGQAQAALAQLPTQRQMDAAQAELRARMDTELRSASPEDAAAMRQAMAGMAGGTPATQMRWQAVQRHTRIADSCTP